MFRFYLLIRRKKNERGFPIRCIFEKQVSDSKFYILTSGKSKLFNPRYGDPMELIIEKGAAILK